MVQQLLLQYGPLKDASTHLPLFNQKNWKTAKQILELIRQGFVSDPPASGKGKGDLWCLCLREQHL